MLNSEKMIVSIQNQDLEHANKYFEKALKNDPEEVLLELGAYLESIGFYPKQNVSMIKSDQIIQKLLSI